MINLLKIALKNLPRHKTRTIITISAVVFGVVAYILINSLVMGAINSSIFTLKKYETGSAQILSKDAFTDYNIPYLSNFFEAKPFIDEYEKQGIKSYPRMISKATLNFWEGDGFALDGNLSVKLVGLNTNYEEVPSLLEGVNMSSFKHKPILGIWLSRYYQDMIGADIGDVLTISIQTAYKSEELLDAEVIGIYETDNKIVNTSFIYYDSLEASTILEFDSETVATNLFIDSTKLLKNLTLDDNLTFKTYDELAPEVIAMSEQEQKNIKVLLALIFIIIVIGISNTMMMAIYERFKEIGTLRAFGMSKFEVRMLFTFEGLLIGLIGALIGALIACLLNIPLVEHGITMNSSVMQTQNIGFRMNSSMKGYWSIMPFIKIIVITTIVSAGFAFLTSSNAFKKSITDCLRNI